MALTFALLIIDGQGADFECSVSRVMVFDESFDLIIRGPGFQFDERANNDPVSRNEPTYLYEIPTRHEVENILSWDCGINDGRRLDHHRLTQYHEARTIRGYGLNNSLNRIFIEQGIGRSLWRVVRAVVVSHRCVDKDHHPFLEIALVGGCSVHCHHCRTGVVVVAGHCDIVGAGVGNRAGHDRGRIACPADPTSGLWAGAARSQQQTQSDGSKNFLSHLRSHGAGFS